MFQSALRMRGLFNPPRAEDRRSEQTGGFNPPCGCVAFSTLREVRCPRDAQGFNPPCGCVAFSTTR